MRAKTWIPLLAVPVLLAVALSEVQGQPPAAPDSETQRIIRGFNISPVPLKLRGRNRQLLGLGSYIVNAQGGCNDCHTNPPYAPGGDPFNGEPEQINTEGFLAGGTAFGPFISANITPDESGRPHGLTYGEFRNIMRTGHDPDRHPQLGPILQVMPWPVYSHMIERDLRAVYEFLRSIPSIENDN